MAGVTVTVQRSRKGPYTHSVVMRRDGQRLREKYFNSKQEAEALAQVWAIEAGNAGAKAAASVTEADKRFLAEARERLAPYGRTLVEAVDFFVRHLDRSQITLTVEALVDKLITTKSREGKSKRYLQDLSSRLGQFSREFGSRPVASLTTDDISSWLANLEVSPLSVANTRRVLSVLFNFGAALGTIETNPVTRAFSPSLVETEVGILTVGQSARLLAAAHECPEILPAVAVGLFAGVRDEELRDLDWSSVNFENGQITIRASKSKSARRRLIEMRPVLRAWLEPLRQLGGPVWPRQIHRGRRLHTEVRREAGFRSGAAKSEDDKALAPWPHNALRHSFASYDLALRKDAAALALELGHTTTAIVFAHYRELVLPEDAERFWKLRPEMVLGICKHDDPDFNEHSYVERSA